MLEEASAPARIAEIVTLINAHGLRVSVVRGLSELNRGPDPSPFVLRLGADEAFMSPSAIAQVKTVVKEGRTALGACLCDSEALRRSAHFGLGKMYEGDVAEHLCHNPRCIVAGAKCLERSASDCRSPSCVALDAFAEIPAPGGNRRPSVMAGFVIWVAAGGGANR